MPLAHSGRAEVFLPTVLSLVHGGRPAPEDSVESTPELIYHQGTAMTSAGLLHTEAGRFVEGDMPWFSLEAARDAVGAFLSVFKQRSTNDLIILGDFHGFQKIFFASVGDGRLLVSDSFLALVERLRSLGRQVSVDAPSLVGQYGSFNALLNHHSFSTHTLVEGVQVLRADEVLHLTGSGLMKRTRSRFIDPRGRRHTELLSDALHRGADMISASLSWNVADRVLYLSGGRDSRSVLAMAVAGGIQGDYPVYAKAPPASGGKFAQKLSIDRAISGQIVDEFGLSLWADEYTVEVASGESEREWWLSHWGGVMHDYGSPGLGSLTPSLFLIGAMGENYRTKVPDFLGSLPGLSFEMTESSFDRDFDAFFGRIAPRHPGSDGDAWDATRVRFRDSLTYEGVGGALWERLDAFSEVFRMSTHFGGVSVERSINRWVLNVLALPELTYAATRLNREERASGRIWQDLHDLADARLNAIPYEFNALTADGEYHHSPTGKSRVDWDSLDVLHEANLKRNTRSVRHHPSRAQPRIDHVASRRLLTKLRDVIAPAVGNPRVAHLLDRVDAQSILMKRMRGKLELLDEVCDPRISWNAIRVDLS